MVNIVELNLGYYSKRNKFSLKTQWWLNGSVLSHFHLYSYTRTNIYIDIYMSAYIFIPFVVSPFPEQVLLHNYKANLSCNWQGVKSL